MARRFELVDGGGRKFWEVDVRGRTMTMRFGRIGGVGQPRVKDGRGPGRPVHPLP